jgi:ribosomal protein L17
LISKAKKAPIKNKNLIIEYIGNKPSKLFFDLAKKYEVRLEDFLK